MHRLLSLSMWFLPRTGLTGHYAPCSPGFTHLFDLIVPCGRIYHYRAAVKKAGSRTIATRRTGCSKGFSSSKKDSRGIAPKAPLLASATEYKPSGDDTRARMYKGEDKTATVPTAVLYERASYDGILRPKAMQPPLSPASNDPAMPGTTGTKLKKKVKAAIVPRSFTAKERSLLLKDYRDVMLADCHPGIAGGLVMGKNVFLNSKLIPCTDISFAWWRCAFCDSNYRRKIFDHVFALEGACPKCFRRPSVTTVYTVRSPDGDDHAATGNSDTANERSTKKPRGNARDTKKKGVMPQAKEGGPKQFKLLIRSNNEKVFASKETGATMQDVPFLANHHKNFAPMLAANWSDHCEALKRRNELARLKGDADNDNSRVYVSSKLDGIRCIVLYEAATKRIHYLSRTGSLIEACDHLEPFLRPFFEFDPELVLDGELYVHQPRQHSGGGSDGPALDFQQVISAVRTCRDRRTPEIKALQERLQYYIFDMMYFTASPEPTAPGKDRPPSAAGLPPLPAAANYEQRLQYLRALMKNMVQTSCGGAPPPLLLVDAELAPVEDLDARLERALQDGYEGIMIRLRGSAYQHGKRSMSLMKLKRMRDAEYTIIGATEGKGKYAGGVGAFICVTSKGQRFAANPATTEATRRQMWARREEFIGQAATVQFQELTRDGVPRFPVMKCVRGAKNGSNWF